MEQREIIERLEKILEQSADHVHDGLEYVVYLYDTEIAQLIDDLNIEKHLVTNNPTE